jgi:hypothetical protein
MVPSGSSSLSTETGADHQPEPGKKPAALVGQVVRPLVQVPLLQRILLELNTLYTIPGSGVRTPSLRKGEFLDPPSMQ